LELVVFPDATHGFNMPFAKREQHFDHNEKATQEAQQDAYAFVDARLK
jgi:dienelactone hydrolase